MTEPDADILALVEAQYGMSEDTWSENTGPGKRGIPVDDYADALASLRGKASQAKGVAGEGIAERLLTEAGVLMVERIATPVKIIESRTMQGQRWVRVVFSDPVSGDRRGILPGGRRVLCEVKNVAGNLVPSNFELHQIEALSRNAELGGLSLVVFVRDGQGVILEWPIPGFRPRHGISFERAQELAWRGDLS